MFCEYNTKLSFMLEADVNLGTNINQEEGEVNRRCIARELVEKSRCEICHVGLRKHAKRSRERESQPLRDTATGLTLLRSA